MNKLLPATLVCFLISACGSGGGGSSGSLGSVGSTGTTGETTGSGTATSSTLTTGTTGGTHTATTASSTSGASTTHGTSSSGSGHTATSGTGNTSGASSSSTGGACNEFQSCLTSSSCNCGLVCTPDPAFINFLGSMESVCERPCRTSADCGNAATYCTNQLPAFSDGGFLPPGPGPDGGPDSGSDAGADAGFDAGTVDAGFDAGFDGGFDAGLDAGASVDAGLFDAGVVDAGNPSFDAGSDGGSDAGFDDGSDAGTCSVLQCAGYIAGMTCPTVLFSDDAGAVATGMGTCVPQSGIQTGGPSSLLICLPVGTATSCSMASDENPLLSVQTGSLFGTPTGTAIENPQPWDPSAFCAQGNGCLDGGCAKLCTPFLSSCDAGPSVVCVTQGGDSSWGFCLPCGSSGSDGGVASSCYADSDCCEQTCNSGENFTGLGSCAPAGG